jgi:hypothetical protein
MPWRVWAWAVVLVTLTALAALPIALWAAAL